MTRHRLILGLLTFAVAACSGGAPPAPSLPASPDATPARAATPSATATAVADSPTPMPTPTPTSTPLPAMPTAAGLPDPCALATQDELDAVAGTPLATGIPAGEPEVYSCTWTGDPEQPLGQIEIYLGDNAKKFLDIDRDTLEHEFTEVTGIADEAWLEENALFFRKGTLWVALRLVRLNDPAENIEPLTELARRVADRLP